MAALAIAAAVALVILLTARFRKEARPPAEVVGTTLPAGAAELAPLRRIPAYRALIEAKAVRSVTVDGEGTLNVDADLRAAFEPRLTAAGFPGASALLPARARGVIAFEGSRLRETWTFEAGAPVFQLLDPAPVGTLGSPAFDSIPGTPTSLVWLNLSARHLADPALGGAALASWRDRIALAEKLVGRSLRAELAEDIAGPVVFALYDRAGAAPAQAVLSLELKRSDRIASLLDMLLAFGALTERGSVGRYRGVATGSFTSASGGPGVALAVDGPVLVVASSRERLESAIDARRAGARHGGVSLAPSDPAASWSAVSASPFVAHGWARLLRTRDDAIGGATQRTAELRPDGASGWRLTGEGPAPAFTADPMIPFLRSAYLRRQRDGD